MSIETVWLTQEAQRDVEDELRQLVETHSWTTLGNDAEQVDYDQRQWRERRIRELQEILRTAKVGSPPDDGVAEPGMVLTVRYGNEPTTETFLLATRTSPTQGDLDVFSPESPIGAALIGAREGETRDFPLPQGGTMRITLIKARPLAG